MDSSIRYSPFPARIGASNWEESWLVDDDDDNTIALSLWSRLCPRLMPCWIRSNFVKFLPESTWRRATRKPWWEILWGLRDPLEVEEVGMMKKMVTKIVTNMTHFEQFSVAMNIRLHKKDLYDEWSYKNMLSEEEEWIFISFFGREMVLNLDKSHEKWGTLIVTFYKGLSK